MDFVFLSASTKRVGILSVKKLRPAPFNHIRVSNMPLWDVDHLTADTAFLQTVIGTHARPPTAEKGASC